MKHRRFNTDLRWWLWISLVLFVLPWLLPIWDVKGSAMLPGMCWVILFSDPTHAFEALGFIAIFSLLFGVPAVSVGWVLQCVVVMMRDRRRGAQNAG